MRVTTETYTGYVIEKDFLRQPLRPDGAWTAFETRSQKRTGTSLYLERSNVVHNPKINGWRNMSPYKATIQDYIPYTVASTQSRISHDLTKIEFDIRQTVHPLTIFPEARPLPFNERNKTLIVNSAFSKLKDQKMNLAVTLAFVGETADLISGTANKLRRAYYFIKRGRWKAAADVLGLRFKDELGRNYLAILFGWMQLARDLQGAAEMLADLSRPKEYFVYGRSKNESVRRVSKVNKSIYTWNTPCHLECDATIKHTQKVVVVGKVSHEGLHQLKRSGLLNPVLIMWDVVRWTWILDQFVSIGQYLNAYDALAGLTYMGGSYTSHTQSKATITPIGYSEPWNDILVTISSQGPCVGTFTQLNRELVSPSDTGIVLKNPFDMNVSIAAAAVLALANALRKGGSFDVPLTGKGPFR